ncbi:MAG: FxLYD domain-containing protein [Caldilineaceae bacterium]
MKHTLTALIAGGLLALAAVTTFTAHAGALAPLFQPTVIDVAQDVPIDVVFALPQEDGTVMTVTAPITVGLSVQVTVQGPQVVDVSAAARPSDSTVSKASDAEDGGKKTANAAEPDAEALADTRGIPYDVQTPDGLVVTQVNSKGSYGSTQIVGQIRNDGEETYKFILVSVSLYDADGNLIDVANGGAQAQELEPGETTTFQSIAMAEVDGVASYSVQVEAMQ